MVELHDGFCMCQQLVKMVKALYEMPVLGDTIADGAFALHLRTRAKVRAGFAGNEAFELAVK